MTGFKIKNTLSILAAFILSTGLFTQANAAVFIAAHPDDIELFMGRAASVDVYSNNPTVFILTTAGDAGNRTSTGPNSAGIPYYRARLNAHESAIRFWKGLNGPFVGKTIYSKEIVGTKSIEKASFGNIVIYNLNLPDSGQPGLSDLISAPTSRLSDIQGINNYDLNELKQTIQQLISRNNKGKPQVWVNIPDPNTSANPGDHYDHINTGKLVLSALEKAPYNCINKAFYKGYMTANLPENLTMEDRNVHAGTMGIVNYSLMENGNPNTWDPAHNAWLGRMYSTSTLGGTCNF